MQISALNSTAVPGLQPTESRTQTVPVEPAESGAQARSANSGEAVVADVSDYGELMGAHTLDPARVAALLADPFED